LAKEHIKELGLEGVHLLICQEPKHIEITVTADTEKWFGDWHKKQLKKRLIARFQPDNPDQNLLQEWGNKLRSGPQPNKGVLEALEYLRVALNRNRPVDQSRFYVALGVFGGVAGVGFLLAALRSRLRKTTADDAGVHDAELSGRSIAVLGGGIGAVTGQWLYRRFFGPRTAPVAVPAVAEEPVQEESQGPDAVPSDTDQSAPGPGS
jgi:hypothetical protein